MKKYFAGRMNRSTYLIPVLVGVLATVIINRPNMLDPIETNDAAGGAIAIFVAVPLLLWQFAASARRFHDFGFSGWFSLAIFLPATQIFLLLWPGNKSENKYGTVNEQAFDLSAVLFEPAERSEV